MLTREPVAHASVDAVVTGAVGPRVTVGATWSAKLRARGASQTIAQALVHTVGANATALGLRAIWGAALSLTLVIARTAAEARTPTIRAVVAPIRGVAARRTHSTRRIRAWTLFVDRTAHGVAVQHV